MDWDFEAEDSRPRYRLCRAGFGLLALAIGLLAIDAALGMALRLGRNPAIWALLTDRLWGWLVGAPITWGSLVGSYLLWGRWAEPRWQRRAGLLVVLNTIDAVLWSFDHAGEFGLVPGGIAHDWLRHNLGHATGWVELSLIAGLAADLAAHLGKGQAPEAATAARSFAAIGGATWALQFALQTRWDHWPLVAGRFTVETYLLSLASTLLLALTSFQVTLLCILAARQSGQMARELEARDEGHELLRSRSEDDPWR